MCVRQVFDAQQPETVSRSDTPVGVSANLLATWFVLQYTQKRIIALNLNTLSFEN